MSRHAKISRQWFLAVGLLLILGSTAYAEDIAKKIDVNGARELAHEAVDIPTKFFDYNGRTDTTFITFELISERGTAGFFSVNPWTGDVWALWGCKRLSSLALRKAQKMIRNQYSPEELKHYQELKSLKPDCITD